MYELIYGKTYLDLLDLQTAKDEALTQMDQTKKDKATLLKDYLKQKDQYKEFSQRLLAITDEENNMAIDEPIVTKYPAIYFEENTEVTKI